MSEYKNIHAIVIDSKKFKEHHLLIKLFTKELGILTLLVRNKDINLPLSFSLFSESIFSLRKGRSFYYCTDFDLLHSNFDLRYNIKAYSFVNLFINIIELSLMENMVDENSFSLFNKVLKSMNTSYDRILNYTNAFLIKYISFQGFRPEFNIQNIEKYSFFRLNSDEGIFLPQSKADLIDNKNTLTNKELDYLYTLLYNKLKILGDINTEIFSKEKVFIILIQYIKDIFEISEFHSMKFIENICLSKIWRN